MKKKYRFVYSNCVKDREIDDSDEACARFGFKTGDKIKYLQNELDGRIGTVVGVGRNTCNRNCLEEVVYFDFGLMNLVFFCHPSEDSFVRLKRV